MLSRIGFFAPLVFAFLVLAPSVTATCQVTSSSPSYTLHAQGSTYYLVLRGCASWALCPDAQYIYVENGLNAGLQRQDPYQDDTCRGVYQPDIRLL